MSLNGSQRVVAASAAAALAGVLTFAGAGWQSGPASASIPVPVFVETPTPLPASAPTTQATIAAAPAARASAVAVATPSRLRIPRLDADLPVRPVGLDRDGAMELPASPSHAGWYRFGPHPGAKGATVIAAHVDAPGEGRGPLAGLVKLKPGDTIEVVAGGTTLGYRVTSVRRINKGELKPDEVFARTGPERLHVVSCGGRFDRATGHYEDNVIAIAVPVQ